MLKELIKSLTQKERRFILEVTQSYDPGDCSKISSDILDEGERLALDAKIELYAQGCWDARSSVHHRYDNLSQHPWAIHALGMDILETILNIEDY